MDYPILHNIANTLLLAQAEVIQQGGDPAPQESSDMQTYLYGAMFVLGIFVIPFILSHFIAKALRMPQHSFRVGVVLAAISGGLLFAWGNNFQLNLGPDMKGGTNIVFDIMPDEDGQKIDSGELASALSRRINPSGTKEITIRPRGESQIEVTVPNTDELELQRIKDTIIKSGQLEFRIVANRRDHQDVIELAKAQATAGNKSVDVRNAEERVVGRWFTVGREDDMTDGVYPLETPVLGDVIRNTFTGEIIENPPVNTSEDYALEKWMQREQIRDIDVLMAFEVGGSPYAVVNGDDLSSATTEFDKTGYVVSFKLGTTGANKMLRLTAANQPDGSFHRRMAIIMDKRVISAPQLNSPISDSGQITGNFTKEEVNFLVNILRSGRLPATLAPEPASENRVGAGLGATTIEKGKNASLWAIAATFICILLYYRFAGVVASMALIVNGLLIFGVMIFIGQPLTLAGLAGLVLTVGMSVDANVLIFERIREEKAKGSAPRMAIRNGFDRAFTTIIDSNLTTLIAAIVLYWIGTDQVRGFAVALVIGIMTSMFTATFCSRVVFEIAEKLKLVNLSMSDGVGFLKRTFLGEGDLNFMGWQKLCFGLSVTLIIVGLAAVTIRGKDLLNIDFTGGSSVTFQLHDPIEADELRELTRKILTKDEEDKPVQSTLVNVEKEPADTVYTLVTSIDNEKFLSDELVTGFSSATEAELKTYEVKVTSGPATDETSFNQPVGNKTRLVAFQAPQEDGDATAAPDNQDNAGDSTTAGSADTSSPTENAAAPDSSAPNSSAQDSSGPDSGAPVNENAEGAEGDLAVAIPTNARTELIFEFAGSTDDNPAMPDADKGAKIDASTLRQKLADASQDTASPITNPVTIDVSPIPKPENWRIDDISGHEKWNVVLPVDEAQAQAIVDKFQENMSQTPLWLSLSKIGTKVAGEMKQRAAAAILLSLIFIVAYIWFRFQRVAYGLAAVVALVHDVLITLGVLALCHWLVGPLSFLMIEDFKIGLTEVAAFLTIIGYSLNDTIVVFDRIREVRGRSPKLSAEMINESVNQTLSRTLLTSGTTLLTVVLLYVFGGEGIHTFAFALLIGVLVGTYSSIFVAAPVLLWISNRDASKQNRVISSN